MGDDFELDGEAGEGFAVNLGVDRICVERFADERVGLPKMDAFGFAEVAKPEGRQVAEIAQTTLCGQRHDFESIFEKVGAGGDFEWTAVIFGAANNGERGIKFLIAGDDSKVLELVTKHFAGALPPVGKNADAGFQIEIHGIDDHAVGSGAADAEEIFCLLWLLEGGGEAEGDYFDGAMG